MLDDPTPRGAVVRLFDERLSMNLVASFGKNPEALPEFDEARWTSMNSRPADDAPSTVRNSTNVL